jgi:hypothetical protein
MLTRRRPAAFSGAAILARCWPLVVKARSGTPSAASIRTSSTMSARSRGSPPVSRTPVKPRCQSKARATWTISSKQRTSQRGASGHPSAGLQYRHRKEQRSVTESLSETC